MVILIVYQILLMNLKVKGLAVELTITLIPIAVCLIGALG